ncbi:AAA family ATPase [Alkalispirochaeta alkalica]|uniref:AAA family ATPase n=1 Tax=Alkalispirochaeta alkalica TaxID=46356 RepID=UPI000A048C32
MRLKSIHIGDYKNLKDFALNFNTACFIDIFVGKNGSGKSNLFEAIILIFKHLFEFGKGTCNHPGFGTGHNLVPSRLLARR